MSFLSPWSLLIFAPLAAAIIFLYLLKLRRVPRLVSSVMLWNKLAADIQANAPFQKLRRNLLLFLQLLALLILIGALARPFVHAPGFEGQSIVLVLDASGSMKATDVSGSRFDQAEGIAMKAIDDLGRGDTLSIIVASAKTHVIAAFTSDKRALAAALNAVECKDTTTRLEDALRLADSLCARKKSAQIVVLSDGAFPRLSSQLGSHARLTFARVGRRADNVAITSLGARRALSGTAGYELFVATQNFSSDSKTFAIELTREGQLLDAREQTLAAGRQGAEVFRVPEAVSGLITAKLDIHDDLAADNTASVVLTQQRRSSALLITGGDLFLERALALDPSLDVSKTSAPPSGNDAFDLVVIEGQDNARLPRAHGYLFINSAGEMAPVLVGGSVAAPTIVDWERNDPVTRYLDFTGVKIVEARAAKLKLWARSLADTQAGPLIAAGEHNGVRSVYLGWDLLKSDFPLRVGFPIFLANCVDWLAPGSVSGEQTAAQPGDIVPLGLPNGTAQVEVTYPSGQKVEVKARQTPLLFEDTETAGVYTVSGKSFTKRFAVNLLSRQESNTQPAEQLSLQGAQVARSAGSLRINKELWRWLLIAALLLVTLEWIAYHKRP